jgi:hypothetical protein
MNPKPTFKQNVAPTVTHINVELNTAATFILLRSMAGIFGSQRMEWGKMYRGNATEIKYNGYVNGQ